MKIPWKLFFQVLGATAIFQAVLWKAPSGLSFFASLLALAMLILLYWPVLSFALYFSREPVHRWRVWGAWTALSAGSAFIYVAISIGEGGLAYLFPGIVLVAPPLLALLGARLANALFVADLP